MIRNIIFYFLPNNCYVMLLFFLKSSSILIATNAFKIENKETMLKINVFQLEFECSYIHFLKKLKFPNYRMKGAENG